MNILIVCIQGMTSGVMAKRLNEIAKEKNEDFSFRACGWAKVNENLRWADVGVLTPQVKGFLDVITPQFEQYNIPCIQVSTLDISFNRIPNTYENITFLVRPKPRNTLKERVREIAPEILFIFLVCSIFHLFAVLTSGWIYTNIFYPLDCVTWKCMSFYVCILLSTYMLASSNVPRTVAILLGIYVILVATPVSFSREKSNLFFLELLSSGAYGPKWVAYFLAVTGISMLWMRLFLGNGINSKGNYRTKMTWLEMIYPMFTFTTTVLAIRIIVSVFF